MTAPRGDSPPIRPQQFGLRGLFRVTFYCAVASGILRLFPLFPADVLQSLSLLLLMGVLLTLPALAALAAVWVVAWLVERWC